MAKLSAGILLYRRGEKGVEVFLAHPGGPFFANRDNGHWSIPKGEYDEDEDAFDAAKREFKEETGQEVTGEGFELNSITLKGGKRIRAWAVEGNADPDKVVSNLAEIDWPPHSGKKMKVPEIDRAEWFGLREAKVKLNSTQATFIDELESRL